jgi:hypothetical protein
MSFSPRFAHVVAEEPPACKAGQTFLSLKLDAPGLS